MSDPAEKPRHPKGLYVLFFTEMWERFGFYTMLFIFTLYLDDYFHFRHPGTIYGAYLALVYFTPIAGGWIADRVLGFRRTIVLGAILLAAGYAIMAVKVNDKPSVQQQVVAAEQAYAQAFSQWQQRGEAAKAAGQPFDEPQPRYGGPQRTAGRPLLFLALLVLVVGNGLFKPNISVMVGNLYEEGNPLKDSAFNIFYMGINIGAFFAPLAAAALRNTLGWWWAFGAAAAGMLVGLAIFTIFQKHIAHAEIAHSADSLVKGPDLTKEQERNRIVALLAIYAIVVLFWMAFHQNGFTMTLWARDSTGPLFGFQIPPETFGAANAFFVVTLTPLVVWFWGRLRRRQRELSTPAKMGVGMLLTGTAFAIMGFAGRIGGDAGRVSPLWLIAAYGVVTLGELNLSPMGLAFCSKVAPPRFRGLMMGLWFGATACGNYLAGGIEFLWDRWPHSTFFFFLTATSLFAALLLRLVLRKVNAAVAS
jgi:POT family proton-dependent oligopeptide transporter